VAILGFFGVIAYVYAHTPVYDAPPGPQTSYILDAHGKVIARLNAEVLKAVGDPEIRRKLEQLGFAVRGSSAEELRVMTRDQLAKYARVIKEMGIANE